MSSSVVPSDSIVAPVAIDRESFRTELQLVALAVPANKTKSFVDHLKGFVFKRPRIKAVLSPNEVPMVATVQLPPCCATANAKANSLVAPRRAILLSEDISAAAAATTGTMAAETPSNEGLLDGLPEEVRAWIKSNGGAPFQHTLVLGYEYLTTEQVLRALLPASITEVPTGFETAGHVAHLNLRDEMLPYKHLIGQVILDKHSGRLRSVVNKTATISDEENAECHRIYRTFPLEVLAGTDDLVVQLRESGCQFKFDFRAVYWNSRLQYEHCRLVELIAQGHWEGLSHAQGVHTGAAARSARVEGLPSQSSGNPKGQQHAPPAAKRRKTNHGSKSSPASLIDREQRGCVVVADMMAGVGPFAIPLAVHHTHCVVHANDLNPESYKWLEVNAKLNHTSFESLSCYNLDARDFLRTLRGKASTGNSDGGAVWVDHVIMNLPQTAIDFLDCFRGFMYRWRRSNDGEETCELEELPTDRLLPMIHVYCFEKEPETHEVGKVPTAAQKAVQRVEAVLGVQSGGLSGKVDIHVVRDVAPKKPMLCLSFRLPEEIARARP